MARLALDEAAWTGPWGARSTGEKAGLALGLLLVAVTAPVPQVSGAALLCAAVLAVAVARVPWRTYAAALAAPAAFIALGALAVVVTVGAVPDADRVLGLGPVSVTHSGLSAAIGLVARSLAGSAAVLLLATTTSVLSLLGGLRALRVPEPIIDIAALMYRLLFSLLDSAAAIREAQAARLGYATARAARQSFGVLAAATLRRAWDQSRRLEEGLAGRGYAGSLRTLTVARPVSVPFVVGSAVLVGALAVWSVLSGWSGWVAGPAGPAAGGPAG